MKTFFTVLNLPVICLLYFFSTKCYIAGEYFAAYTLVLGWFVSVIFWIKTVGTLFTKKPAVVRPAVPRAYITRPKAA